MKELKIVRMLLDKFNNKVNYCHWKSNQHFSDALIGVDDLDILIDRTQTNEILTILSKLNFKHFYTPYTRTYIGIEDWLGFDEETGKIIHLHLHYNLVVGEKHLKGFHLPYEYYVLKNRRWDENSKAYMSSYFDELLLLILRLGMKNRKRDIIKNSKLSGSTKNEFEWLKKNCPDFDKLIMEVDFLENKIKENLSYIYNYGTNWFQLNKLKHQLYTELNFFSQGSGIHNTIKRNFNELNRIRLELKKRFLPSDFTFLRRRSSKGGIVIAFLGSDGSGKSSSIKEIDNWLIKVVDVRNFYMGSGDGNSSLMRKPLKLLRDIAIKMGVIKRSNNVYNEKTEINSSKKISFAKKIWVYTLSRERIKKLIRLNRCKIYGYTVLTDRYPQSEYNGLCDGPRLAEKKGMIARKEAESFRIAKLCPPDLVIKLIVSPEEAKKRKPDEINLETSKNLTERIKKIQFSPKTKIVSIDADKPQDEVILEIKRAIWDKI